MPFGADTMWASMTSAYDCLPEGLKLLFRSVEMEHDSLYLAMRHDFGDAAMIEKIAANREHSAHPAVVGHHATGKPCLFVGNAHIQRIKGYDAEVSEALIRIANDMSKVPELQVRHQWEPGDVALWDNIGTTHYGVSGDVTSSNRLLHRVAAWAGPSAPRSKLRRDGRAGSDFAEAGPVLSAVAHRQPDRPATRRRLCRDIMRDLDLSRSQFALIAGLAFSGVYAFTSVAAGLLADRWGGCGC